MGRRHRGEALGAAGFGAVIGLGLVEWGGESIGHMVTNTKAANESRVLQFGITGVLLGLATVIGSLLLDSYYHNVPITLASLAALHKGSAAFWFLDAAPVALGLIGAVVGMRELRLGQAHCELQARLSSSVSEARFHKQLCEAVVDHNPTAVVRLDADRNIIGINRSFEHLFGFHDEDLLGKNLEDVITTNATRSEAVHKVEEVFRGESFRRTSTRRRKDGQQVAVEIRGIPVMRDGSTVGAVAMYSDVSNLKMAEDYLSEREATYRSLFHDSPISLWEEDFSRVRERIDVLKSSGVTDLEAYLLSHPEVVAEYASLVRVTSVNQSTLDLFGARSEEEFQGGLARVFGEESYDVFREELLALARGQNQLQCETVRRTFAGEPLFAVLKLSLPPGYEDTWSKVFVSVVDITERKKLEEHLKSSLIDVAAMARTDTLTGLLNRRAMREHLEAELKRSQRLGMPLSLVLVDIDNFKAVNDQHGHLAGDQALVEFSRLLEKEKRVYDWVGRWGGDEFLVILPGVAPYTAGRVAQRLWRKMEKAEARIGEDRAIRLTCSMGASGRSELDGNRDTLDVLLSEADRALFNAKGLKVSKVRVFSGGK